MRIVDQIKDWYRGRYVPPPENDPNSKFFIISVGHYEKSPGAKLLTALFEFWLAHWKWIIATGIGLAALIIAL